MARMRQPKNALWLGLLALYCICNARGNIGAGILYGGAYSPFLAMGIHDFASVASLERHADLYAKAWSCQGCKENQCDKGHHENRDNQANFFQGATSVKKLPMFRNLS
jgi:hypothetical protein